MAKVNVTKLCRESIAQGLASNEVIAKLTQAYTDAGRDAKYAAKRAQDTYKLETSTTKPAVKVVKPVEQTVQVTPEVVTPVVEVVQSEPKIDAPTIELQNTEEVEDDFYDTEVSDLYDEAKENDLQDTEEIE